MIIVYGLGYIFLAIVHEKGPVIYGRQLPWSWLSYVIMFILAILHIEHILCFNLLYPRNKRAIGYLYMYLKCIKYALISLE